MPSNLSWENDQTKPDVQFQGVRGPSENQLPQQEPRLGSLQSICLISFHSKKAITWRLHQFTTASGSALKLGRITGWKPEF